MSCGLLEKEVDSRQNLFLIVQKKLKQLRLGPAHILGNLSVEEISYQKVKFLLGIIIKLLLNILLDELGNFELMILLVLLNKGYVDKRL